MEIAGSTCIVFGGAQGIGLAYVEALLDHEAIVLFTDILEPEGRSAETRLRQKYGEKRVIFMTANVQSEQDIQDAFNEAKKQFGVVTIVVNNCGVIHEFDWQRCLDINVGGNIRCINAAREHLGKDCGGQGGLYVCTASISGLRPEPWGPVYSASKHATVALVRSWAEQENYASHGIRMNCICPTRVETPFLQQVNKDRMYHADQHIADEAQATQTLRPAEVAEALIRIVQDDSLNGQAVRVTRAHGVDMATFQEQPPQ